MQVMMRCKSVKQPPDLFCGASQCHIENGCTNVSVHSRKSVQQPGAGPAPNTIPSNSQARPARQASSPDCAADEVVCLQRSSHLQSWQNCSPAGERPSHQHGAGHQARSAQAQDSWPAGAAPVAAAGRRLLAGRAAHRHYPLLLSAAAVRAAPVSCSCSRSYCLLHPCGRSQPHYSPGPGVVTAPAR